MRELDFGEDRALRGMTIASAVDRRAKLPPRAPVTPIVFVVDHDPSVRSALERLIRLEGWQPASFASADAFLARSRAPGPSCLVLDATLPNSSGLEVQRRIAAERPDMPVIFVTDRGDVAMTVQAMKAGAAEFLVKPLCEDRLVDALRQSLARSAAALDHEAELQELRDRYAALSGREREVMRLVVSGRLNKQVGGDLGISEITVKAHRGRVMRKMRAGSFVDLVHMAMHLRLAGRPGGDAPPRAWPN